MRHTGNTRLDGPPRGSGARTRGHLAGSFGKFLALETSLRNVSCGRRSFAAFAEPAPELHQDPHARDDDDQPRNDCGDGGDERRETFREHRTRFAKRIADGREGAAAGGALLGAERNFDKNFFGFVCENFALCGFAVELGLRFGKFFLNSQKVGNADAGLGILRRLV